jgi:hypothetical protein
MAHARTLTPRHIPTLAERRRDWRALIAAARALAGRVVETCGRERLERTELVGLLGREGRARFPIDDASAGEMATGFRTIARALLIAGTDRRRELIAPALAAAAEALDQLITDQGHAEAARSRLVAGERPDTD